MILGFQQTSHGFGDFSGATGCSGDGVGAFTRIFTQDDLVGDLINVHHTFGTEAVIVQVFDNNNQMIIPSEVIINDEYDVDVSLANGTPIDGTWRVTLIAESGGCNNIGSYARTFTQDDLVNGALDIYHYLASEYLLVQVYDNSNQLVHFSDVETIDINSARLSLSSFEPIEGTWHVTIISTSGYIPTTGVGYTGPQNIVGGSVAVSDEGSPVSTAATVLNFIGEDVFVQSVDGKYVNVFIPPPIFPSVTGLVSQEVFDGQLFSVEQLDSNVSGGYSADQFSWRVSTPSGDPPSFFSFNIDNTYRTAEIGYPQGWTGSSPVSETVRFIAQDPSSFEGFMDVLYTLHPSPPTLSLSDVQVYDPNPVILDLKTMVSDMNHYPSEMEWSSNSADLTLLDVAISNGVATITPKDPAWVGPTQLQEEVIFYVKDPKGLSGSGSSVVTIVASPPVLSTIPNQTVFDGQVFNTLSLDSLVTDMGDAKSSLVWSFENIDGSPLVTYQVSVSPSRVATVSLVDPAWTGTSPQVELIRITVTDPKGLSDYKDVEFTTNPSPPVTSPIPSQEISDGQSFTQVYLDNYVSDINHTKDLLVWGATLPNGDPLEKFSVSIVDRVATISVVDEGWLGEELLESIMFTVTDPKGLSDTVTTSFRVVASPPIVTAIPSQSRVGYSYPANPLQGETVLFDQVLLDNYVSDINNTKDQLTWVAIKTNGDPLENFSVSIVNRVATVTQVDNSWTGSEIIRFKATDPKGLEGFTDSTFSVTPTPYVSNFNTQDGTTNALVPSTPTSMRNIPSPTSEGNPFKIGDWVAGVAYPTTRSGSISYTTNGVFLLESLSTDLVVEVLDADLVTVLATKTVSNLSGDTTSPGVLSVGITDWGFNYNLFKAQVSVGVNISNIIPAGGRFYVRVTHDNGSKGVFTKSQESIFFDPDTSTATIGSVEIQDAYANIKYLSGLKFYGVGSTLKTVLGGISNINDRSYPNTLINVQGGFNLTSYTLTGPQITDWANTWNKVAHHSSSANMTINSGVYMSSGTIEARVQDWSWGTWVPSQPFLVNVDTSSATPSRIFEDFKSEVYRYESNCTTPWDSSKNMSSYDDNNGLQVFQGRLVYRSQDFTAYNPQPVTQPNYSGYNGVGTYYRFMWHANVSHSSGVIKFSDYNFTESEFQAGSVLVDISLNKTSWFSLNNSYFGGALDDGEGCRVDIASNNLTNHNRIKFTLGTGGFTSSASAWGIFIRIKYPSGSTKYMGQMEIVDWV